MTNINEKQTFDKVNCIQNKIFENNQKVTLLMLANPKVSNPELDYLENENIILKKMLKQIRVNISNEK